MREIKFRYWNGESLYYSEVLEPMAELFVDPDVLDIMECTGVKDKGGDEIWEGDIVRVFDHIAGKEKVTQCVFAVGCSWLWESEKDFEPVHITESAYMKVIGNIHETPQLRLTHQEKPIPDDFMAWVAVIPRHRDDDYRYM